MRRPLLALLALLPLPALAACGSSADPQPQGARSLPDPPAHAAGAGAFRDWTRFGYTAARANDAPGGLTRTQVAGLQRHLLHLPGTVDASPIALAGVRVNGARHDIVVMTTTYGRTFALDAHSGRRLWMYTPGAYRRLRGTYQFTTATPVADASRRYVFAASPDGRVRKLSVATGKEVRSGHWPAVVTRNAGHEKLASALNLSGRYVLATTGGYIGDAPPYQGKVLAIDRFSGRVVHVFNSLCSNRRRVIDPSSCRAQESAIWGRAGAVVDPVTHRVYATSSNGPFDGRTNWGDSVLELSPTVARFLRHYTPRDQRTLEANDTDLGSTSPALLPLPGRSRHTRYLVQGGKDGKLRLLSLSSSLHGVRGAAGRRLGGEKQIVGNPGGSEQFTATAVQHSRTFTRIFVATGGGTGMYTLVHGRLARRWEHGRGGTSPVLARGLLYVYDPNGALLVYDPRTGRELRHLSAPSGHWNSPIVAGGSVFLPTGDANAKATSGVMAVYR